LPDFNQNWNPLTIFFKHPVPHFKVNLSEYVEKFYAKYTNLMTLIRKFLQLLVPTPNKWCLCHTHTAKLRKVTSVLFFAIHNAMKKCCGVEVKLPTFIISAMDVFENSVYGNGDSWGMNPWHQYRRLVGP
jgi:hypothetical protein